MSADDRLDQDNWTPPANWEARAAALTAAVHRHADIPSWDQRINGGVVHGNHVTEYPVTQSTEAERL